MLFVRAQLGVFSGLTMFVSAFALVPYFGVSGFAYAMILQSGLLCIGIVVCLMRKGVFYNPVKWTYSVFKEVIGFNLKMNFISMVSAGFDPIAKVVVGQIGGLALVGVYELASRIVTQVRAILMAYGGTIIPEIAILKRGSPELSRLIIEKHGKRFLFLAGLMALSLSLILPLLFLIVFGNWTSEASLLAAVLLFTWTLNLCAAPIYLSAQAQGITMPAVLGAMFSSGTMIMTWILSRYIWSDFILVPISVMMAIIGNTVVTLISNLRSLKIPVWQAAIIKQMLIANIVALVGGGVIFVSMRAGSNYGLDFSKLVMHLMGSNS
jgi:O-antigen/teichoic acid export membrane protein